MSNILPKGWTETTLLDVARINPKSDLDDDLEVGFIPMALVPVKFDQKVGFEQRRWSVVKKGYTHFKDDDVIFAKITPCFENSKAAIIRNLPNGYGAGSTEYYVLRPIKTSSTFLFYFVKTKGFLQNGESVMTGSVGQKRVPKSFLLENTFPLPPLNEQKRIVAKLDKIIPRIEAIKERLDKIPILIKRFRQSILTAAVTGKLTEKWREEHPENYQKKDSRQKYKIPLTWCFGKLDDFIKEIQAGKNFSCPEIPVDKGSVGIVKISAVTWDKFDPRETKTVIDKSKINKDLFIQKGDFLISRANTIDLVGASVIVDEIDFRIMLSDKVWRVQFLNANKCYINYFLKSRKGRDEIEIRSSGNQESMRNISQKAFRDIDIPFPPLEEQKEIVCQVDQLFTLADKLEQHYQKAKAKLDKLSQSVLAKAFRGELVPQDPNDEPAEKLLERIQEEKAKMEAEIREAKKKARKGATKKKTNRKIKAT